MIRPDSPLGLEHRRQLAAAGRTRTRGSLSPLASPLRSGCARRNCARSTQPMGGFANTAGACRTTGQL
eukprot:3389747-Prymnesium_polylepis.1